ncbi:tRNA methyltransferase, has a role in tRNA modification [Irineochytrium annulatum]|nr:tRNA methyltransferase, has a role in tRNA modification [Irineochytrium annulatum]
MSDAGANSAAVLAPGGGGDLESMDKGVGLEREHVQRVYEAIAPHFSGTRYKCGLESESRIRSLADGEGPRDDQASVFVITFLHTGSAAQHGELFSEALANVCVVTSCDGGDVWLQQLTVLDLISSLEEGSIGADVGCGNGKYLGVNKSVMTIGSDMSSNLIGICRDRGFEALVADNQELPFRTSCFDFVLSIAVIHHFSSPERRISAIQELTRILKPGGKMLIFVWAMEQEGKRKFERQDVFVPWTFPKNVFKEKNAENSRAINQAKILREDDLNVVYQRYYHLFTKGELDGIVNAAGGLKIEMSGYDRDNWYVIARKS